MTSPENGSPKRSAFIDIATRPAIQTAVYDFLENERPGFLGSQEELIKQLHENPGVQQAIDAAIEKHS
ncbi:hypothetical protein HY468_01750 [Candidatus Roizmanbacteria bacterium]|nr:hypothetical protein [Candidatus Roizmanbacteria bacterium]